MISAEFINSGRATINHLSTPCKMSRYLESCLDDINEDYNKLQMVSDRWMTESAIMGEDADTNLYLTYEAEGDNFFKKLGDKIIEIYEKVKKFLREMRDKIKSIGFKSKTDIQKLDVMVQKHPELKDQVISAYTAGSLELNDIKSITELEKAYEAILKMNDESAIQRKWDKAVEAVEKHRKVIVAATAAITLVIAIRTYKSKIAQSESQFNQYDSLNKVAKAKVEEELEKAGRLKDADGNDYGLFRKKLAVYRDFNNKVQEASTQDLSAMNKLTNILAGAADKLVGSKPVKFVAGDVNSRHVNNRNAVINKAARAEADAIRTKAAETSATELAKLNAQMKHHRDNKGYYAGQAYNNKVTSAKADFDFKATHPTPKPTK